MLERSANLDTTMYREPYHVLRTAEQTFYVKTDEPYNLQYGDRTIEVYGDADIMFEDLNVEGYGVWVIRHHDRGGAEMKGYTYSKGEWLEVS